MEKKKGIKKIYQTNNLPRIDQTPPANNYQQIRPRTAHIIRNVHHLRPVRVALHSLPDAHDFHVRVWA